MKRERGPLRGSSGLLYTGKCDKITSLYRLSAHSAFEVETVLFILILVYVLRCS